MFNPPKHLIHIALFIGIASSLQARAGTEGVNCETPRKSEEKATPASRQVGLYWRESGS